MPTCDNISHRKSKQTYTSWSHNFPSGYSPFSLFLFIAKFLIRESILCFLSFHSWVISFSCTALHCSEKAPVKVFKDLSTKSPHSHCGWPVSDADRSSSWKCVLHFLLSHSSPCFSWSSVASQVSLLVLSLSSDPRCQSAAGLSPGSVFFPSMIPSSGDCVDTFLPADPRRLQSQDSRSTNTCFNHLLWVCLHQFTKVIQ